MFNFGAHDLTLKRIVSALRINIEKPQKGKEAYLSYGNATKKFNRQHKKPFLKLLFHCPSNSYLK